ncbi:hypothetical protein L6258_02980 [Candidatus Parcubacteria bacterium]|nr:hypothetical protein [Candidatus Parcubacteria bacterium]
MPSGTEKEALEAVDKAGGEATIGTVATELRIDTNYARLLCNSLGRADYIDVLSSGICKITPKGKRALGKD